MDRPGERRRNVRAEGRHGRDVAVPHGGEQPGARLAVPDRRAAGEQVVQGRAEAVDIGGSGDRFAGEPFRRGERQLVRRPVVGEIEE